MIQTKGIIKMKFSTLLVAAALTLSVSACSTYEQRACTEYPTEHYQEWHQDCGGKTMHKKVKRTSSYNDSLDK